MQNFRRLLIIFVLLSFSTSLAAHKYGSWKKTVSAHFTITFPQEYEALAHTYLELMEREYSRISDLLGYQMKNQVHTILEGRFSQDRTTGLFFYQIEADGDFIAFRERFAPRLAAFFFQDLYSANLNGTASLYRGHVLLSGTMRGAFFDYVSFGFDPVEEVNFRNAVSSSYTLDPAHTPGVKTKTLYRSLFGYIGNVYGDHYLRRFFREMIDHNSLKKSLETVLGKSYHEIVREWNSYYRSLIGESVEGHSPLLLRTSPYLLSAERRYRIEYRSGGLYLYDQNKLIKKISSGLGRYGADRDKVSLIHRYASFTSDSSYCIVAEKESHCSTVIIYDLRTKREKSRTSFPFISIASPYFDMNSGRLFFTGYTRNGADLYSYDYASGDIVQITHDAFVESSFLYIQRNDTIFYLSNSNSSNLITHSRRGLHARSLADGTDRVVVSLPCYGQLVPVSDNSLLFLAEHENRVTPALYDTQSDTLFLYNKEINGTLSVAGNKEYTLLVKSDRGYGAVAFDAASFEAADEAYGAFIVPEPSYVEYDGPLYTLSDELKRDPVIVHLRYSSPDRGELLVSAGAHTFDGSEIFTASLSVLYPRGGEAVLGGMVDYEYNGYLPSIGVEIFRIYDGTLFQKRPFLVADEETDYVSTDGLTLRGELDLKDHLVFAFGSTVEGLSAYDDENTGDTVQLVHLFSGISYNKSEKVHYLSQFGFSGALNAEQWMSDDERSGQVLSVEAGYRTVLYGLLLADFQSQYSRLWSNNEAYLFYTDSYSSGLSVIGESLLNLDGRLALILTQKGRLGAFPFGHLSVGVKPYLCSGWQTSAFPDKLTAFVGPSLYAGSEACSLSLDALWQVHDNTFIKPTVLFYTGVSF